MKKVIIFLLFLSFSLLGIAQDRMASISFQDLDSLQAIDAKPTIVFLYTDWCRYCKGMEKTIFSDSEVKNSLQDRYYFIRFNGESEDEIQFRGNSFNFKPSGKNQGVHELAQALGTTTGTLSFPTVIVLNKKLEIVYVNDGYMTKPEFLILLSLAEGG